MSEQTETVKKRPPAKHKPRTQSSGSNGAFLAMVIALAAGGGSYYVWQQHLIAEQDRAVLQQSIEQLLEVVEQKDQAQLLRIEQLREHQHSSVEQRVAALEQSLPDLSQQLSLQQRDWTLAEVDYLLRLADHRLQLNHDIPTAIAALSQAREQLIKRTNGNFTSVADTINENINILSRLEQNNINRIIARLGELISALDTLPFAGQTTRTEQPQQAPAPLAEGAEFSDRVKYWGRVVWRDLKSLVTIRRSAEISRPLMNPEQRYFLQAQLRLKLESARLAAMGHNQPLYRASLEEASSWLSRYYDSSDSAVIKSDATLNELLGISVDPELPSLQALRQQLHTEQRQAPVIAPEPVTEQAQQPPFMTPAVAHPETPLNAPDPSTPAMVEEPAAESQP